MLVAHSASVAGQCPTVEVALLSTRRCGHETLTNPRPCRGM